jgi:hypothetical protein
MSMLRTAQRCGIARASVVIALSPVRNLCIILFELVSPSEAHAFGVYDEFMVQPVRDGALNGVSGLVKYLPEFIEAGC